jgi:zinc transport system substrate-binding protein
MKFFSLFTAAVLSLTILFCGCKPENDNGKIKVAAGLPPIGGLVKIIGGDRIEVISILPEGKTPHDFSPTPQTIRQTSGAKIFLTTRMPFEEKIANAVQKSSKVCDVSNGIERIAFHDGANHQHHHHGESCSHDSHDPHVWLSPANAIIIAENIRAELTAVDPAGAEYYQQNFNTFKEKMLALDKQIAEKLSPHKGKTFFVYHPAFGYFAHAYSLKQRAIELNGREIGSNQLSAITREAREANVSTIFVQEQFNPRSAKALASQIGVDVVPLDPLSEDLPGNLEKIATALDKGFAGKR